MMIKFPYRLRSLLERFGREEHGGTIVEFALVLPLFLLIFFGMIDFGRMAFHYVTAERAMHVAARVAAVRLPACSGVPEVNARGTVPQGETPPDFGTSCSSGANICVAPAMVTCAGSASNATATEVWDLVRGTLPNEASIANLSFRYDYDSNLGFLGGPYVPVVTVELQGVTFRYISPLGALVGLTGGAADANLGANVTFPSMSVSMPAEDLALGNNG